MSEESNISGPSSSKSEKELLERVSRLLKSTGYVYSQGKRITTQNFVSTPEPTPSPTEPIILPTSTPAPVIKGEPFFFNTSHNGIPLRGYIYLPIDEENELNEKDVVILFHGNVNNNQQSISESLNILQDFVNVVDNKVFVSLSYPQENILIGDNLLFARGIFEWVRSQIEDFYGVKLAKLFLFGHSYGGYLAFRLNTEYNTNGLIVNAPSFIDLVTTCEEDQNSLNQNSNCKLIEENFGNVAVNLNAYSDRSLLSFIRDLKDKSLVIQGLDDNEQQVQSVQKLEEAFNNCTECVTAEFLYISGFGNLAYKQDIFAIQSIKEFLN